MGGHNKKKNYTGLRDFYTGEPLYDMYKVESDGQPILPEKRGLKKTLRLAKEAADIVAREAIGESLPDYTSYSEDDKYFKGPKRKK